MNSLLLVIDCQKGFINKYTEEYVEKINDLVKSKKYDFIAFTKFINSKDSIFYKRLNYNGCIDEEEQRIVVDTKDYKVFSKSIYTAVNDELKQYLKDNNIDKVYLCGFDTDACVLKTALDLFENNIEVYVLKDYCSSSAGKEIHDFAIRNLKILIGENHIQ